MAGRPTRPPSSAPCPPPRPRSRVASFQHVRTGHLRSRFSSSAGEGDMAHRLRLVGPLCVVVAMGLVTTMNASASKKVSCSTQVNDTAAKLLPCIKKSDLINHMQALENIAIANPGPDGHPSRNSGEPGY